MSQVTSKDGTIISYDKLGSGPALILVDGAMCSRAFGPMPKLAPLLAKSFTVFMYDRRGRGQSGDSKTSSKQREIEDLEALIEAAGGSAILVGLSSGGALALEAAAAGVKATRVVAYEPPYVEADGSTRGKVHATTLKKLLDDGNRGGAVKYFMGPMVGAPAFVPIMMQAMFWMWPKLKAVAHTLPYDCDVMGDFTVPTSRLSTIKTPTLALHGGKTTDRLKRAAATVASSIPNAKHKELAGQDHNVDPRVLTPAVIEFAAA